MRIVKYILIVFTVLLFGCEDFFITEIDPPKSSTEPQLVVHNYLSPQDTVISISVTLSNPMFSNSSTSSDFTIVENATVTLYDQDNHTSVSIPYNVETEKYSIDANEFPIVEQGEYKLTVSTPEGKSVNSICIIPKMINSDIHNIQFQEMKDQYNDNFYQLSFEFEDEINIINYYSALAVVSYTIYNYDIVVSSFNFDLFSDYNKDGETIFAKSNEIHFPIQDILSIEIMLFSVDENYYHYHKTSIGQLESGDMGPFSEPTIIVSNIENGLGVFCGYTMKSKTRNF